MSQGRLAGFRSMMERFFPERQFYHRSHGEVHFVSLSGTVQLFYLSITLSFLTWVGYASVNVVFKEQIISEKEQNFVVMQKQYEQRLVEISSAYDEINSVLVLAEQRFGESTKELEDRHNSLKSLVDHRQALNTSFEKYKQVHLAERRNVKTPGPGENTVLMRVTDLEPTARRSRRPEVEEENPVQAVTMALGRMLKDSVSSQDAKGSLAERVATLENRVEGLRDRQRDLISELEEETQNRATHTRAILEVTGLGVDQVMGNFDDQEIAEGGPLIALADSDKITENTGNESDPAFQRQIYRLANQLQDLTSLEEAMVSIPMVLPVNEEFRFTSPYGARRDPYTKRRAFHSGMDMAGRRGALIVAPAPGVVTHAGPKGPYGNLVEIDHGHGFKTRYGHLRKVHVKRGEKVDFYQKIATLGSTGRSTGPHLHYEVWFNNKVRDPAKFVEAGKYVFKE
jgi:murein DD-endopeptidase MepM/ murein hydrolase activator NlpD